MEQKLLQRQLTESSIYFADEFKRQKKTKLNILLAAAIVSISLTIRFAENNSIDEVKDNTTQKYLDTYPKKGIYKFNRSQIA